MSEKTSTALTLVPIMTPDEAKTQLAQLQAFVTGYMVDGEDYGIIPGTQKKSLFKPGAEKLCEIYGLAADVEILHSIEDWKFDTFPMFDYTIKTKLSRRDGTIASVGLGSCNSWEGRYKWRKAERLCPECGKDAICISKFDDKNGNQKFGKGSFYCFAKKDGCNAKFAKDDQAIIGQEVGQKLNDDIASQKNTILKMAKKRSYVDAVIAATRSGCLFTQDVEDFMPNPYENGAVVDVEVVSEEKKPSTAKTKASTSTTTKTKADVEVVEEKKSAPVVQPGALAVVKATSAASADGSKATGAASSDATTGDDDEVESLYTRTMETVDDTEALQAFADAAQDMTGLLIGLYEAVYGTEIKEPAKTSVGKLMLNKTMKEKLGINADTRATKYNYEAVREACGLAIASYRKEA